MSLVHIMSHYMHRGSLFIKDMKGSLVLCTVCGETDLFWLLYVSPKIYYFKREHFGLEEVHQFILFENVNKENIGNHGIWVRCKVMVQQLICGIFTKYYLNIFDWFTWVRWRKIFPTHTSDRTIKTHIHL